jgi:hypothetical protein
MVKLTDVHPLTGFLRDHKSHVKRLQETGRPELLTVNGRASVVVQDAEAYQRLMELADAVESERIVRERVASLDTGEPGIPLDAALAEIRERLDNKR